MSNAVYEKWQEAMSALWDLQHALLIDPRTYRRSDLRLKIDEMRRQMHDVWDSARVEQNAAAPLTGKPEGG